MRRLQEPRAVTLVQDASKPAVDCLLCNRRWEFDSKLEAQMYVWAHAQRHAEDSA